MPVQYTADKGGVCTSDKVIFMFVQTDVLHLLQAIHQAVHRGPRQRPVLSVPDAAALVSLNTAVLVCSGPTCA